jgi:HD domain
MRLADLPIPSSPATRAAAEVANEYHSPALANHCLRSYLFAAALGQQSGVAFDAELLFVAALLHDLGLEAAFDSHTLPFEQAGGQVAWVFAAGAGWPRERRARAAGVIVAHMADPTVDGDPEGYLLARATGLDISGYRAQDWSPDLLREVLTGYPRLDLASRFSSCFRDQAARKPDSAAADSVRSGIADRLAGNPLERLTTPPLT